MNTRQLTPLPFVIVMALLGCDRAYIANSNEPKAPVKTQITKESLKARLSQKSVRFVEREEDHGRTTSSGTRGVDIGMPELKILSATPMKVSFRGKPYELEELTKWLDHIYYGKEDVVAVPATEADISFYNTQGITVEDYEMLIAKLSGAIEEFQIEFVKIDRPPPRSADSKPTPPVRIDPFKVKAPTVGPDDGPPPPPKKATP